MFAEVMTLPNGRRIGPKEPVYIIAEIGSNHNGSLEQAKALIKLAKGCGADAAKFQSFQVGGLIHTHNQTAEGNWQPHPAWDILDKLTVPEEWHAPLQDYANEIGIDFLSAPFDLERLDLLHKMNVPAIKIASGDLTHHELLKAAAATGKPILLSTGMAYLGEVKTALDVLYEAGCRQVGLFHCVSLYPPVFEDANIRAVGTLYVAFHVPIGYSDHTPGSVVPLGAVAMGASIIEKHLTNDKTQSGPDHPYALDGSEFKAMVEQIRNMEKALGDGEKTPRPGEIPERVGARRALYASQLIAKGSTLTSQHVNIVRHAYAGGIPAEQASQAYGKTAKQDIPQGTLLSWDGLA